MALLHPPPTACFWLDVVPTCTAALAVRNEPLLIELGFTAQGAVRGGWLSCTGVHWGCGAGFSSLFSHSPPISITFGTRTLALLQLHLCRLGAWGAPCGHARRRAPLVGRRARAGWCSSRICLGFVFTSKAAQDSLVLTPFRQPLRPGHTVVCAHCIQHTELRKWRRIPHTHSSDRFAPLRCCCSSSHGSILSMTEPRFRWLECLGRAPSLGCSTSSSTRPSVSPMPAAI